MKNSKKLINVVLFLLIALLLSCSGNDEPIQEQEQKLPKFENTETMTVWDEDMIQLRTDMAVDPAKYDLFIGDSKQEYTTDQSSILSFKAKYKTENEDKELPIVLKDKQEKTIASGGKIKILRTYRYYPTSNGIGSPYSLVTFILNNDNSFYVSTAVGVMGDEIIIRQFNYLGINDKNWVNTNNLSSNSTEVYPPKTDFGRVSVTDKQKRFYPLGFAKYGNKFYITRVYRLDSSPAAYTCPIFIIDGNAVSLYKYNNQAVCFQSQLTDIVVDSHGNLFVYCVNTPAIYKLNETSGIQLFAGSETESGYRDGKGNNARFGKPLDDGVRNLLIDGNDNIYVAEKTKIRKITPDGTVSTFIGTEESADVVGSMSKARFTDIKAFAMTKKNVIYLTEENTDYIKIIDSDKQTVAKMKVVGVPGSVSNFSTSTHFRIVVNEQGIIFMEQPYTLNGSFITVLCPNDLQKKD